MALPGNSNRLAIAAGRNRAESCTGQGDDRNDAAFLFAASLQNETRSAPRADRERRAARALLNVAPMAFRNPPVYLAPALLIVSIPAIAAAAPVDEPAAPVVAGSENDGDHDTDVVDSRGAADRVAYGGPGSYEPALPEAPIAPPVSGAGLAGFRDRDAAAGRAYLSPTAVTAPRGKVTFGWMSPIAPVAGTASIGFGLTDRVQLSVGTTFTAEGLDGDCEDCFAADDDGGALFVAKVGILRGERTALAAQAAFIEIDGERTTAWSAVLSHCVDGATCNTVISGHLTVVPEGDTYDDVGNPATALHGVLGGSLVTGGGRLKAVVDAAVLGEDEDDRLLLGYGGIRYAGRRLSADLGLVVGVEHGDAEALPLPLIAISGRL